MKLAPEIYEGMGKLFPFLLFWSFTFTLITSFRILKKLLRKDQSIYPDSSVFTELIGLPLTFLQSYFFVQGLYYRDFCSSLLFLWWGPGFLGTIFLLIYCKIKKIKWNWYPYRLVISYLCKISYLAYVLVFWSMGRQDIIFVFSVWILNDQYGRSFLSLDGDRFRRTFDDYWIFRIAYPLGLLLPCFFTFPYSTFCLCYGFILLALWLSGMFYIYRKGFFLKRSQDPTLLRNMVYFKDLRLETAK
jgi:hypothetical protein